MGTHFLFCFASKVMRILMIYLQHASIILKIFLKNNELAGFLVLELK